MFLGIYGDQFPLYFPECVAHFPLSGNDQIVVVSKLKLSGASFIITPPFSEIIQSIYIFVYTNIGFNYACSISTEKPRKPYGSGVSYVWTQWCHSTPILTYTQCCTSTSHCSLLIRNYSMIVATRPDPTVLPPSRIAKVRPCSIAIGWISSMVISTLSPGMHISVPAGSSQTPVTSVVLK